MARLMTFGAKCSDLFNIYIEHLSIDHNGYVPDGLGIGGGDYIEMTVDMDTGQIQDWKPITDEDAVEAIEEA